MAAHFIAHVHPVFAVSCPSCKVKSGVWCQRPSEHKAQDLLWERKRQADAVFIEQHGPMASVVKSESGWIINSEERASKLGQLDFGI